jgi:hypothetical protein
MNQLVRPMEDRKELDKFVIRPYTKTELGKLYSPTASPQRAWQTVHRWIERCKPLSAALKEAGLKNRDRLLSPRQVRLITQYLGEP